MLKVGHVFDIGLMVRHRRTLLHLHQIDLAQAAGVSREWIIDLERGKPTLEIGKILRTLEVLELPLTLDGDVPPPAWAMPKIRAAGDRERERRRLRNRPRRRGPKPPADWTPPIEVV